MSTNQSENHLTDPKRSKPQSHNLYFSAADESTIIFESQNSLQSRHSIHEVKKLLISLNFRVKILGEVSMFLIPG